VEIRRLGTVRVQFRPGRRRQRGKGVIMPAQLAGGREPSELYTYWWSQLTRLVG
jgi:hypothetical protein